jgi:dTDP-4-amino-4,6-dideoxygalactose transaminase
MIPLFKPYIPENLAMLDSILKSGALSYGTWGEQFEKRICQYIGCKYVLTTNSFNSAMLLLISTIGLEPGDEIIASPMSCLASNQPFASNRIRIVWADIDPSYGTMCPESVKSKICGKTKMILHNHFCGYPGYIEEINGIAKSNGIVIVDDAIEAFGSEHCGRKIGSVGSDATVFSFQPVRLPNTIDGGAVVFESESNFRIAKEIRDYGIDRSTFRDVRGEISETSDIKRIGYGATMNEISSYLGCQQMDGIGELLERQRVQALRWHANINSIDSNVQRIMCAHGSPNYWIYGALSKNKLKTFEIFRNLGYRCSTVHYPNSRYTIFGKNTCLSGVNDFYSKFVALPCGWWV